VLALSGKNKKNLIEDIDVTIQLVSKTD